MSNSSKSQLDSKASRKPLVSLTICLCLFSNCTSQSKGLLLKAGTGRDGIAAGHPVK